MENQIIKTKFSETLSNIFIGLILILLHITIWNLNYVFFLLGHILLIVSFRNLKNENYHFQAIYNMVCIKFMILILSYLLDATILRTLFDGIEVYLFIILIIDYILSIALLYYLKKALVLLQAKAGTNYKLNSIKYIIIMKFLYIFCITVLMNLFIVFKVNKYIYMGIMILGLIIYVYLYIKLYNELKPFHSLHEFVSLSINKLSNKAFVIILLLIMGVGIISADIFYGKYPMNWQDKSLESSVEIDKIEDKLVKLSFPEKVLKDISEKDILDCSDAINVYSKLNKNEDVLYPNTGKLKMYSIMVELNNENDDRQYKIFHYFEWVKPHNFYGTECLFSEPPSNIKDYQISDLDGKLFYNEDHKEYQAAFYSIENISVEAYDEFGMYDTFYERLITADFSLPLHANKARGYLTYQLTFKDENIDDFDVQGSYLFQKSWLQYPKVTAKDTYLSGSLWNNKYDFLHVRVKTAIK